MVAHPGKSETMKIGTKHAIKKAGELDIYLKDHKLKEVTSYKYLGVSVDSF
jgi:threonine dehydratase